MRLLNSSTKTLEDFIREPPPYAILSHTWEEEEVEFSALKLTTIDHTSMMGWYKISRACEQALADGFSYLWVDTVCIDKSSSSELSEAINSMFKWYRDSAVCYVYLYDHVPGVHFRDSKWFTRGWTLQEMIAPRQLRFYGKTWDLLGTKDSLMSQLHAITGVDTTILNGGDLRLISVARKMSWAAKRQTSRVEDIAYCLLGLFDISMPMLYGEGHKAFRRLQEEIVKEYDDHSLFAWTRTTGQSGPTGLLAQSPADFMSSSYIVPWDNWGAEPTVVTSRGLRLTVSINDEAFKVMSDVEEVEETFLAALNCRQIVFGMQPGDRIALGLRRCHTSTARSDPFNSYIRPDRVNLYTVDNHTLQMMTPKSIYVLKEDHFYDEAELRTIWIRTMPKWPQDQPFELVSTYPRDCWDERTNRFQVKLEVLRRLSVIQFVLVFRQSSRRDGNPLGTFVVYLGFMVHIEPSADAIPIWSFRPWCSLSFQQGTWDPKVLELILPDSRRDTISQTCWAGLDGERKIGLQCYVSRMMSIAGQRMCCADLNVSVAVPFQS